ncbi:MAG TPA: alcohol dehydrogenase, partial [Planctomycetaceae bacterium]|nr:alcohol dehydrogenase [Planctomycetaceae bacterium]
LKAQPEKLEVLQKLPVLDGKTWNHPIVVGDRLFMRNAKAAVCLQLAP